ncbi:MAG: nicotinate-nucleotide diphosphorylase (carboxylating) [Chloroflexi bacterium RBG_19FT_COMBO_50_10]|nr:MAG: nicotinate-nucleotide diphosphorylase (carboxylating) [Chloroflexi bacterium RBG_19FT_COMBO_50_10]
MLQLALAEDLSDTADLSALEGNLLDGDITSRATISEESCLMGYIRAKATGVVAGLPLAGAVFSLLDPGVFVNFLLKDGDGVQPGTMLAEVSASGQALLAGERTGLNLLGRMSGIATLTRQFVEAVAGTQAIILDTRKTAPGLRYLDKYSVRCGGGQNHRIGLFDMILIKDNHISGAGGITPAVTRAREMYGGRYTIEVEVKDLTELDEALSLKVDRIMLDNMDLETMRIAVQVARRRIPLEASGNVSLNSVRQIAETGVDFISSGALTHSAPTLDISMKIG